MKEFAREFAGPAALLAAMLLVLAYCKGMGSILHEAAAPSAPFVPVLSSDASAQAHMLIERNWDAVLKHCPGLSEFSADITADGSDNQAWGEPNSATVIFKIARQPGSPTLGSWGAGGHTCYFGLVDGHPVKLSIVKPECVSVCLARRSSEGGAENFVMDLSS